ncbi:MAG: alanine--tRNA ligase [Bacteroidetes bacterium HGW-Bacteroidetes-17]|jgi:alanyl-tRNA synthetase|nr:MAG: alanine--tRNA ligase [Bacteroidetes bacterium HGW-Bacteroidetes-17]
MNSNQVRQAFLDFFEQKSHQIVESAPMVIKNDPTLMFTNAGMNQFKDIFLGNSAIINKRIADTQKCLRVSGKHNDLEEVGRDTYHHTMFEMLGNWSFGDYFKKEAIAWAWELLTEVYKIPAENLYITVFGGDDKDKLTQDDEALNFWKEIVPENRILFGSKKDNFWEMGDTGPCGPCSEIHIDIRNQSEKEKISGDQLVNKDHPLVIEIWNLVFIEFNRKANGELVSLPAKHVDTGMGFERLSMVLQGVQSNYDTDIFQPIIQEIARLSNKKYGESQDVDIAMRVIADHLRAVSFAISDGQLPSNTGAGYVIRRILRRGIRYGYTFLGFNEPFINDLVPTLVKQMGHAFPNLVAQQELVKKVIAEEELSFLRTLAQGVKRFEQYLLNHKNKTIDSNFAFELFDTFGFPIDLTQLMATEEGWKVDMNGFEKRLIEQKDRSRKAAAVNTDDWVILNDQVNETEFLGYTELTADAKIIKYRKVEAKNKKYFEVVLDRTPFYAESGGQVGDKGLFYFKDKNVEVFDTKKDNNLTVHFTNEFLIPNDRIVKAAVVKSDRQLTANNHSATHLMHAALRRVLGTHVEQKGSLVEPQRLRFDFSHFSKLSEEELSDIEEIVNAKIRENIPIEIFHDLPIAEAKSMGAMALFGEKYGDNVRVIRFDKNFSTELCGGIHVASTGQIGLFKIISEGAIAAGVRRIEAITAKVAVAYYQEKEKTLDSINAMLKHPKDLLRAIQKLIEQNQQLSKQVESFNKGKAALILEELKNEAIEISGINLITKKVDLDMESIRDLSFSLNKEIDRMVLLLASENNGKANLSLMISEHLVTEKGYDASKMIREIAKEIQGGGGGQPHLATAGGSNINGIAKALTKITSLL